MLALVWKQFLYVSLLMVLVGPFRGPFFYRQIMHIMSLSLVVEFLLTYIV